MDTKLDKLIFGQQAIALSVQLYHAFALFNSAPELQTFIVDNYDLLAPVYKASMDLLNQTGWASKLQELDIPNNVGTVVGQGVNILQPDKEGSQLSSPIVKLITELPMTLNQISSAIDEDTKAPVKELKIKQRKIQTLASVFEYGFSDNIISTALFKIPDTIWILWEIGDKAGEQNTLLQKTALEAYQGWVDSCYPIILKRIDAIEVQFNIKSGTYLKL